MTFQPTILTAALAAVLASASTAQEPEAQELETQDPEAQAKQDALERALSGLDPATDPGVPAGGQLVSTPEFRQSLASAGPFRLYDLSFDLLTAVGTSSERDGSLRNLQAGQHDPRKRGFTLQNAELALMGAVDPYFRAETNLVFVLDPVEGETIFELEEAFLTTTSLPHGLELEFGQMYTEFGRINPNHPHTWAFQDQPVILSRIFGADGQRAPGARLGWLTPLPWFAEVHVGLQNANGETMPSFIANDELGEERPIGGRPYTDRQVSSLADMVWLVRLLQSWQIGDWTTVAFGASALFGPNATGDDARTQVYGADLIVAWTDGVGGRQAEEIIWQSEFAYRDYEAAPFVDDGDPMAGTPDISVPGTSLQDWGFYTQLLYRFEPSWRAGIRYEYATGSGNNWDGGLRAPVSRATDPFRDDRYRLSPLLQWQATHFSRIRLQYNYDRAEHLDSGDAHSVWLGFEVGIGAHAAHKF